MTAYGTITWAFTHRVASRDGETVTAECGRSMRDLGWTGKSLYCPDCYPDVVYPPSPDPTVPITYSRRAT